MHVSSVWRRDGTVQERVGHRRVPEATMLPWRWAQRLTPCCRICCRKEGVCIGALSNTMHKSLVSTQARFQGPAKSVRTIAYAVAQTLH